MAWAEPVVPEAAGPSPAHAPQVVVELYTSQGCGMCPAANAFLAEIAEDPGVLALSFSVDYWDPLGWADTLADPAFTARQTAYVATLDNKMVYTPQMVLNGAIDMPASRKHHRKARRALAEALDAGDGVDDAGTYAAAPELAVEADVDGLLVRLDGAARVTPATVWLVSYDAGATRVMVDGGFNRNKTLDVHNAVRTMTALGDWSGGAQVWTASWPDAGSMAAVLVQPEGLGPVLAANTVARPQ